MPNMSNAGEIVYRKFKDHLSQCSPKVIQELKQELIELSNKVDEKVAHSKKFKDLLPEMTAKVTETEKAAIYSGIESVLVGIEKDVEVLKSNFERSTRYLNKQEDKLRELQNICPHINTKHSHTDYHKNIEEYECLDCGADV